MLAEINQRAKELGVNFGDFCREELQNKGYIWNDCFGWEKPEVLQQFNLDPNMVGIPHRNGFGYEYKSVIEEERDEVGQKTGNKTTKQLKYETQEKTIYPTEDWLNYITWKKERQETQLRDEFIAEEQLKSITGQI